MDDDVRPYLEIRTAAPLSVSADDRRLLVSSDLSGTAQVRRLDAPADATAVAVDALAAVTAFEEPIGAGYLPVGERILLATDRGGNERTQLYLTDDAPDAPYRGPEELEPLVVDDDHIHRPGGVTRDGRLLAYATNRADGVAFDTWVRRLDDGDERRVYATGGWTGPGGFSPNGRWLAVSELSELPGDNRVALVDLERLGGDVATAGHEAVVELAAHRDSASVGVPSWLPDSEAFYFATDVGDEVSAVARGTPDGSWSTVLSTGWPTGCALDWAGSTLLVAWNADGVSRARLHDPHTLEPRVDLELPGEGVASGFRLSRDGRWLVYAYSSPLIPGDVWRTDTRTGATTRLTASPCPADPAGFVDAERVRIDSFDGLEIPLFVYRPRRSHALGARSRPVVVMLHGGPESQYRPSFSPLTQYLVSRGFAVVAPNVRGSTGYGRTFQHLDDVERRFDAVRDLEAVHDWLASEPTLDEDRAALYGGSYGGWLVLAGLTFQPQRWAAGVDIVGMSNLVTFLENTAPWRRAFREREYGSLVRDRTLLEQLSPINHVDALRAPLFIVHGANDPRVPLGEAEQIHEVLRARGIPSELRVYPDEGHGLAKLHNRLDCYPRIAAFLHDVLNGHERRS
jgi:dienelactone hydrolase